MAIRAQARATAGLLLSVAAVIGGGAVFRGAENHGQPHSPNLYEIVARVPARASDSATREIDRLHSAIRSGSVDTAGALRLARLHMAEGRRKGDPRHFGYAEAVLNPLCGGSNPNADALVLRGMIHQTRHRFEVALADLDRALSMRPSDTQAWLVRASILAVMGRYEEADQSCDAVAQRSSRFVAAACRAPFKGLRGQAAGTAESLNAVLGEARGVPERAWGLSLLGDLAMWVGDVETAEKQYLAALSLDQEDRYSRGAYADLLLEAGRAKEARTLLENVTDDDGLLIRVALAEQAMGASASSTTRQQLRDRFDADRRRGEPVHGREEARFTLSIERQPVRALELALENWSLQHEPWDARLVMEAALAAGKPKAALVVLAWIKETGFEDPRLRALSNQVERTL